METKRVMKKSARKIIIISIIVIVTLIVGILLIKHYTSKSYKLSKLGYTKEQVKEIIDLNKTDLVLGLEYNDSLVDILKSQYYIDENLNDYIDYHNLNTDKSIDDVIAIVNVHANNEFYSEIKDADTSLGNAILVNKYYKVGEGYTPDNLVTVSDWYSYGTQKMVQEAYDQYKLLFNAAKKDNLTIIINDSYRTYESQDQSYKYYGDDYAARAGHSEHHTGLAVDVVSPSSNGSNFNQTEEYKWLQNNSYKYGFILRYPEGKEYLTGYEYESWHYRYLGVDLATKVHESGLTYDEYYAYYIENK